MKRIIDDRDHNAIVELDRLKTEADKVVMIQQCPNTQSAAPFGYFAKCQDIEGHSGPCTFD